MTLAERLQLQPFQGYAYSYPHKLAYRRLEPVRELAPLWAVEDRDALFLYVHIPFCEMRCGFCNLFTTTNPGQGAVETYLAAIERQMAALGPMLGRHRFARAAFGGGTPTFLSEAEIARLFAAIEKHLSAPALGTPVSFEMSPATVTPEKMKLLVDLGVTRASLGVQSYLVDETKALGRQQDPRTVLAALDSMRAAGFAVLNVDLIYGAINQTVASWLHSLREALRHAPEEVFLYPLYVRPLTGLNKLQREPSDLRHELYRAGRDFLCAQGYEQISMRLFRRAGTVTEPREGAVYCCQEDGMLGFGPGARSYTRGLHYSSEYAVGRAGVREIIDDFARRTPAEFACADYGCELDEHEQRRRYIIKSILRRDGLDAVAYAATFDCEGLEDFPQLEELLEQNLAEWRGAKLVLNAAGLERSDTIGPWLFSAAMNARSETFELV